MANNTEKAVMTAPAAEITALRNLPDLSKMEVAPTEIIGDYWSPKDGDSKRVCFVRFDVMDVIEQATGENRELEVVVLLEQAAPGEFHTIQNGSARLVGQFKQMERFLQPGMPFEVKYLGKKKNSTNSFTSDYWSIKPLISK